MRKRLVVAGVGLIASAGLLLLFSANKSFAEFFASRISLSLSRALGRISSIATFPVFELLVMLAIAAFAAHLIFSVLRAVIRKKAAPLAAFLTNVVLAASIVTFVYVLTWPAQLYSSPFADSVSFYESPYTIHDLEALCRSLITRANELKTQLSSPDEAYTLPENKDKLIMRVPELVASVYGAQETPSAPKIARYPEVFRLLNIAGLYSPWSGEPIINPLEPAVTIPFTACHEAAHSAGFAKEDDANFIAYLACMNGDADFQYSGTLSALYYAMEMLRAESPDKWESTRAAFDEAVYRDFYAMNGFRDAPVTESLRRNEEIADVFLRIGGQQGLGSYSQMVVRLLDYERGILLLN